VPEFGLIVVTRKRVKQSLERQLTDPCPYCSGSAVIKSTATICYDILSEVKKAMAKLHKQTILLRVNPEIALALKTDESEVLRELEQTLGLKIQLKPDMQLHHEQFDMMTL
jgi:ribonuclease G